MTIAEMLDKLAEIGAGLPPEVKPHAAVRAAFKVNEDLTVERSKLRKALEEICLLADMEDSTTMRMVRRLAREALS